MDGGIAAAGGAGLITRVSGLYPAPDFPVLNCTNSTRLWLGLGLGFGLRLMLESELGLGLGLGLGANRTLPPMTLTPMTPTLPLTSNATYECADLTTKYTRAGFFRRAPIEEVFACGSPSPSP